MVLTIVGSPGLHGTFFRNFKKQNMYTKGIHCYDDISISEILTHNVTSVTSSAHKVSR